MHISVGTPGMSASVATGSSSQIVGKPCRKARALNVDVALVGMSMLGMATDALMHLQLSPPQLCSPSKASRSAENFLHRTAHDQLLIIS